ncbi:MAG: type B DNA-directed DNA polymerase [Methanospirillum sp.]|uniref:type B DNA-directed DNA polymerase n=1 Tax=Methanospirillum sp. TaxID=45200 RepID=UPI00236EA10D|nr:type B DNA-directed DNA polymerase [Methanospirillum sp.]MDD1730343.1 type B DNA-directed DNA polymerase [Methanospirillum sp.]
MKDTDTFTLDTCRSATGITTWEINAGTLSVSHHQQSPSFLVNFIDPHLHYELIEDLESRYKVRECTIRSIYDEYKGYSIGAGREIAELIEQQTRYQVALFNVDIRPEQRFAAKHRIVPGGWTHRSRFDPGQQFPGTMMEISCSENPHRSEHTGTITVRDLTEERRLYILNGSERQNIDDLFEIVQSCDPDLILYPDYDRWSSFICDQAERWGIPNTLSRTGRFKKLSPRSYFSYGRMEHRLGAMIPEGRIIIDTRQSFMHREGNIRGILLASRLTGLSPNLTCRLTPGTLVSSYEVYEALARNIAVPFRKKDAETRRKCEEVRLDYRGGLTLQPSPGIYEDVTQIDFTSFYPSIIVKYNLSPETIKNPDLEGFLPSVLDPILKLRCETKQKMRTDHGYAGMDEILKWMLVTCFGYTGYKNARFGRIEVHEQITFKGTELLQKCITRIVEMNGRVLHAIIDCLFVQQCNPDEIKTAIEDLTGFFIESETYDWIVFLPQIDGTGAYGSYYGRIRGGGIKVRGIAARRRNTPRYIQRMQEEMFTLMASESRIADITRCWPEIREIYHRYSEGLKTADFEDLVIKRRIGREKYQKRCIPQAVINTYQSYGVDLAPGMDASFVVRDEKDLLVDPDFDPKGIDIRYYQRILDRAWKEVEFVFQTIEK